MKTNKILLLTLMLIIILSFTSIVSARPSNPNGQSFGNQNQQGFGNQTQKNFGFSNGQNNMMGNQTQQNFGYTNRQNNMMGNQNTPGTGDGVFHDERIAYFAEKLGISEEDLNTQLENGKTLSQIADESGLTIEQFQDIMTEMRDQFSGRNTMNSQSGNRMGNQMNQNGGGNRMQNYKNCPINNDCPYNDNGE
jgi:hypothetical protein